MEHGRRNHPYNDSPLWKVNKEVSKIKIVVHGDILHDSKKRVKNQASAQLSLSEVNQTSSGQLTVQPGSAGIFSKHTCCLYPSGMYLGNAH